jgi:hypothetical protein
MAISATIAVVGAASAVSSHQAAKKQAAQVNAAAKRAEQDAAQQAAQVQAQSETQIAQAKAAETAKAVIESQSPTAAPVVQVGNDINPAKATAQRRKSFQASSSGLRI